MNLFHQRLSLHKSITFSIGKEANLLYWQAPPKIEYPGDKMWGYLGTHLPARKERQQNGNWWRNSWAWWHQAVSFNPRYNTCSYSQCVVKKCLSLSIWSQRHEWVRCQRRQVRGLLCSDTQEYWQGSSYMIRLAMCEFRWQLWLVVDIREAPGRLEEILEKYRPS